MKWQIDAHKFFSETTRTALKVIAEWNLTASSDNELIKKAERKLAELGVYRDENSANGRIRTALFTYFKNFNCIDNEYNLTEMGKALVEDKITIKEFCFWRIVNYKYVSQGTEYFPVYFILKFISKIKDHEQAYLTINDFYYLNECNDANEITDQFVIDTIEKRNSQINVKPRSLGFDVWMNVLTSAGILNKKDANTFVVSNASMQNWLLSCYEQGFILNKGDINTGIISLMPTLTCGDGTRDKRDVISEVKFLRALLFENIEDEILNRYIICNPENDTNSIRVKLGLNNDVKAFYTLFKGYEQLVGYHLLSSDNVNINFIGSMLLETSDFNIIDKKFMPLQYKSSVNIAFSRNRIIFGAPGTGKSFRLEEDRQVLLDGSENYERVTFHPDYTYANFVGAYKPVMKETNGEESISYTFVPGPFTRMLVNALKHPECAHLLIIEEINRANVAAVFGDIFQLLDRNDSGISQYNIQTSEDLRKYLAKELNVDSSLVENICIPDNLCIWATMNSADQGVYPLDTAFKRRWDFEYIEIDENSNLIDDNWFEVGEKEINWNSMRIAINEKMSEIGINEDKLLGPFFIGKIDKLTSKEFVDVFCDKVIMYLYEDAARIRRDNIFNIENNNIRYSVICNMFREEGKDTFVKDIAKLIKVRDVIES